MGIRWHEGKDPQAEESQRLNLSLRMHCRRLTRLTNGHSKTQHHHIAGIALFVAFYNYCRPHMTLREKGGPQTTPAMAAGLTDHVWTILELLETMAEWQSNSEV